jgi:hypothetical protein
MIPYLRPHAVAALCGAAACIAHAAPAAAQTMKPGLWQSTSKTTSRNPQIAEAMAEMQKHLASMTPEQRKAMRQKAGQVDGPDFSMNADGTVSVTMCITEKMIDEAAGYLLPQDSNCVQKKGPLSGATQRFSYTCSKPPASGEGQVVFQGGTAYTSTMTINSEASGQKETMLMEGKGKWLGADCGAIKPVEPKPPAGR